MEKDLLDSHPFSSLELHTLLLKALGKLEYKNPTLIQSTAIPLALKGKDILARARTGSGKTAAYCLPILDKILCKKTKASSPCPPCIKALILVPTKELSEQVHQFIVELLFFAHKWIKSVNLTPGELVNQRAILAEKPDILVSTPSKILSHLKQGNLSLKDSLECLVIDEADLILSYGYEQDMKEILEFLPTIYQSFLMSATMSPDIEKLKQCILRNPAIIKLEEAQDPHSLEQFAVQCETDLDRYLYTFFIIKLRVEPFGSGKCILFVNSIDQCYKLKLFFEQFGIKSCALNSELPLKSRYHIVQEFNRGIYDYLIATDESGDLSRVKEMDSSDEESEQESPECLNEPNKKTPSSKKKKGKDYGVARGIDFKNVNAVINFDVPKSHKSYMHRVGRTARGVGNKGYALTYILKNQDKSQSIFEKITRKQSQLSRTIQSFEFDPSQIQGFKYRVEDALRSVTGTAVKEARLKDLKSEILTSEKLKAHFEANPKDLYALRHDKPLHPTRVQSHMKHIPDYLLPKGLDKEEFHGRDHSSFHPRKRSKKWSPTQVYREFVEYSQD